jgi:hypothetical protein
LIDMKELLKAFLFLLLEIPLLIGIPFVYLMIVLAVSLIENDLLRGIIIFGGLILYLAIPNLLLYYLFRYLDREKL